MSCAVKIGHSTTAGLTHLKLIVRRVTQSIGRDTYSPVKNSRSKGNQDDIVRNVLLDSEHTDPEHVWGDEGPVNDP